MALTIKIPSIGESITEVEIGSWLKREGDSVRKDENVVVIESEKASIELPAPAAGKLSRILKKQGETVAIGTVIAELEEGASGKGSSKKGDGAAESRDGKGKERGSAKTEARQAKTPGSARSSGRRGASSKKAGSKSGSAERSAPAESEKATPPRMMPAARRLIEENELDSAAIDATGPGGRILKEDVLRYLDRAGAGRAEDDDGSTMRRPDEPSGEGEETDGNETHDSAESDSSDESAEPHPAADDEEIVPMSPLRRTVARRLVEAQQQAALLTTFNEIDMSATMTLRKRFQDPFQKKHGVRLGFMSFFVKAAVEALRLIPQVNAEIRGTDIVYRNHYDIGVAIGGGKGLVVPVIRRAEKLGFAEIESVISDFAARARDNKLTLDELRGGTFTISNGGIYGSLLSTPIVNPPQSGILGMHTIQDRPCAVEGQVVIRPMMYVALTYDHRIVDGREAVTFLKRIKDVLETPERLLLEV